MGGAKTRNKEEVGMKMNLILAAVTLGAFLFGFQAMAAGTITVNVNCDKGGSITDKVAGLSTGISIDGDKSYIVKVSGTCNENVQIADFEQVSLQVVGNPTATIKDASGTGLPVISVTDSRRVTLSGLTINGETRLSNCRDCFFNNNIVNSTTTGLVFFESQGSIQNNKFYMTFTPPLGLTGVGVSGLSDVGMFANEIHGVGTQQGLGVAVTLSSRVRMSSFNLTPTVIDGFGTGLLVRDGSGLLTSGPLQCGTPLAACILVSHNFQGARITSANASLVGVTFDGNGQGVYAELGSTVAVGPNSAVTNSTGVPIGPSLGIFVTHNSSATVGGASTTIANNGTRGVAVGTASTAL